MAPAEDVFEDIFSCGLCQDYLHEPVTTNCCAGCNQKLPYQVPSCSQALTAAMEKLVPEEVARRAEEEKEEVAEEPATCYGGFRPWQTVAAARDIGFGNMVGVRQGMPGIIIGNFGDGNHVTVKFDTREDGSELCVNVLPSTLMNPLPGGLQLGQKVSACYDLLVDGEVAVHLGTPGIVGGQVDEEHLQVYFYERADGVEGILNVPFKMIAPYRLLVGGFKLGQKVQASMDLLVGTDVCVRFGTPGIVLGEYSDTRLTIAFDVDGVGERPQGWMDAPNTHFNVLPMEIRAFSDTPCDMPPGLAVQAKTDLISMNSVVIKAGTRGVIIACMDETRIIVSFEGSAEDEASKQCLTVTSNAIEKAED